MNAKIKILPVFLCSILLANCSKDQVDEKAFLNGTYEMEVYQHYFNSGQTVWDTTWHQEIMVQVLDDENIHILALETPNDVQEFEETNMNGDEWWFRGACFAPSNCIRAAFYRQNDSLRVIKSSGGIGAGLSTTYSGVKQ